jgi:hypothetical protein
MRVRFRTGGEPPQYTPYQDCEAGLIRNFYVHSARKCGSRRIFMGTWRQRLCNGNYSFDSGAIEQPKGGATSRSTEVMPCRLGWLRPGKLANDMS